MQYQNIPHIDKVTFTTPKNRAWKFHDSFVSDKQKMVKTEQSEDQELNADIFDKTHFKSKMRGFDRYNLNPLRRSQISHKNCLLKIQEKLKKHAIFTERNDELLISRSQFISFNTLTTKNSRFKSLKVDSESQQKRQKSSQLQYRPITLKKKINMIRKHKEILQQQFLQRKTSHEHNQRTVSKQQKRLKNYIHKFEKIKTVREQSSRQRQLHEKQRSLNNEQILRQNYLLRSTVLGSQQNLKHSRISLCLQKLKQANETRVQKQSNIEEVRISSSLDLKHKKQKCESIKLIKLNTQQSVQICHKQRVLTVNQRKLQQISRELVALQNQKKKHNTFNKVNEVNDTYQNKIKNKKIELQQKAKMYKLNLMLQLNKSKLINVKNQEEEQMPDIKNTAHTQKYRRTRNSLSTQPDLNLISTKSNTIYKKWDNPMIASNIQSDAIVQQTY